MAIMFLFGGCGLFCVPIGEISPKQLGVCITFFSFFKKTCIIMPTLEALFF